MARFKFKIISKRTILVDEELPLADESMVMEKFLQQWIWG